jgi:predicted nucleic acid-binding protein
VTEAYVIDASALVECLVSRDQEDACLAWLSASIQQADELWAPDLIHLEVGSALRKLVRRGFLPAARAERSLRHGLQLPLTIVPASALVVPAWGWRDSMTIYDAAYAALARITKATVVTRDRKFGRALARHGVRVVIPGG